MAENTRVPAFKPPPRRFDIRELSRLASWGLATLAALTLAAYATSSEIAGDRLVLGLASIRGTAPPDRLARTRADPEAQKIAEAIRELAVDRDRLLARLDTIERSVGDITSSIAPTPAPTAAPAPPEPEPPTVPPEPPIISAPVNMPANLPNSIAARWPTPSIQPAPAPTEEPAAAKSEFGIDLGRASNIEGLRQIWTAVKGRHSGALEGLRPIVAVREIARPGNGIELRLVAGPIPNAAAAARLCASLLNANCHPTVFDGQRLAFR